MRLSRFYNSGQILRLFDGHIDAIPFRQDVHPSMVGEVGNVTTIMRLK